MRRIHTIEGDVNRRQTYHPQAMNPGVDPTGFYQHEPMWEARPWWDGWARYALALVVVAFVMGCAFFGIRGMMS